MIYQYKNMGKRFIIVRHGNTFRKGETPTRIGAKTDLPLVEEERARSVGKYLLSKNIIPDKVYTSPLKRTRQTAALVLEELKLNIKPILLDSFVEIDYGVDENKTEEEVIERLGRQYLIKEGVLTPSSPEDIVWKGQSVIDLWNQKAIVPDGWLVDVDKIIATWKSFAEEINEGETALLVSSNGIIRFAPYILDSDYDDFCSTHDIKVVTGGVCLFEYEDKKWTCKEWNVKPYKLF